MLIPCSSRQCERLIHKVQGVEFDNHCRMHVRYQVRPSRMPRCEGAVKEAEPSICEA